MGPIPFFTHSEQTCLPAGREVKPASANDPVKFARREPRGTVVRKCEDTNTWSVRKVGARWREAGSKDFSAEKYF